MIRNSSICFLIGQLGQGGSERQLYNIIGGLIDRGWDVSVITLNPDRGDYWEKPIQELGVRISKIMRSNFKLLRLIQIIRVLKLKRPKIVHSWSSYANFYSAIGGILAGVPVRLGSERGNPEYSKKSSGKLIYPISFLWLDGLVTNSEITFGMIKKDYPHLDIEYIPNGVNIDNELFTRNQARKILNIPLENLVVAGIGSLIPVKNFSYLISMFHKIQISNPTTMLVIIGNGPDWDSLTKQATRELPPRSFKFIGTLENAYKYMNAIDILCITSFQEGMPNVAMEALAAGIPVIANNVGSLPQLMNNGTNGLIVEPGNEENFYDALQYLLENQEIREKMGKFAKDNISQFSTDIVINKFISFYQRKLASKKTGN